MANVPANAKKPSDHQTKQVALDDVPDVFSFTHDGTEYKFDRPTGEVITPGWLRRNRKTDDTDAQYSAIEQLASDDVLDVIDNMGWDEHRRMQTAFTEHVQATMGVTLGESGAS